MKVEIKPSLKETLSYIVKHGALPSTADWYREKLKRDFLLCNSFSYTDSTKRRLEKIRNESDTQARFLRIFNNMGGNNKQKESARKEFAAFTYEEIVAFSDFKIRYIEKRLDIKLFSQEDIE